MAVAAAVLMTQFREMPAWLVRREVWLLWCVIAVMFALVPVTLGGLVLGWDALNHHFYLGWVAQAPRFDRDLFAAGYQAHQYPYLYWPLYRLAAAGASGIQAGIVLALLQSIVVPAIWLLARACCPGVSWTDFILRLTSVALAFMGGLTLSLLDSTSNDVLASIPYVWAVALGIEALRRSLPPKRRWAYLLISGALAGVSIAFKLSNGPIAVVLPVLWALGAQGLRDAFLRVSLASTCAAIGLIVAYMPWGAQLWVHFGNPIHPFYDFYFDSVRRMTDWKP